MANTSKAVPADVAQTSTGDHQTIAQIAVDLHIARRNFLIYPATHEQVLRSLARTYKRLNLAFAKQPEVKFVVLKKGLAVGNKALPATNPVYKDLAAILKQYQIATLIFARGLQEDELARFLKLVVEDRQTILSQGGFDVAVAQAGFDHIKVQTVDYSQLQVTEEEQIARLTDEEKPEGSIWQQFITRLTTTDGQDEAPPAVCDPGKMARLLNENAMGVDSAVKVYKSLFSDLSNSGENQELITEDLVQFQQMIKELSPVLQEQFLSATFNQFGKTATVADTARLVDGFGGDIILRMLKQASDQDKEISPSLLAFVKKMVQLGALSADSNSPGSKSKGLAPDEVGTLMAHEQYDSYVDQGYGKLLDKLAAHSQKSTVTDSVDRFQQELEMSLTATHINSHVGLAMMALMNNSDGIESYRQWARQLSYFLDELLESHAFVFLTDIIKLFTREKESPDPEKAKIAALVLDSVSDPELVARAVEIVQGLGRQVTPDAMEFLSALGEPVVVEIFDSLDPNDTFYLKDCVEAKLVDKLAACAVKEALGRLDDPRPDYIRRMIRIVRRMGDGRTAEQVRPLLQHADMAIRMEALATLLKFGNKWGLIWLRDTLKDPMAPELQQVIALAGRYKVLNVLPTLLSFAERGGGDRERQEAALRALGNMGDVRAVPILKKLVNRRWSMSKKHNHHIKQVVFATLAGYPFEEVKALVHFGFKQKDAVIKSCCEQVLRKQAQS